MTFTQRRLCWAFGGESEGLFIENFFQLATPSLLISIVSNWTELQQNFRGSRIEFIFCMRTPDLTLQSRRVKNYWSSDGLQFHIHLILQAWVSRTTTCSALCQREKKFDDENDLKMDLINFFGQNSQDFYERWILSLPERWWQVIDSNGAYIVES